MNNLFKKTAKKGMCPDCYGRDYVLANTHGRCVTCKQFKVLVTPAVRQSHWKAVLL